MTAVTTRLSRFLTVAHTAFTKSWLSTKTMPSALVFLAEGAEEMETVITVDVLRRAEVDVTLAGVHGIDPVVCSRFVKLVPDKTLQDALSAGPYDILICPGGGVGADNLSKSAEVGDALKAQMARGGYIAAVCAAPTSWLAHDIAKGRTITSHPGRKGQLKDFYNYKDERVVVDGNLITSRGPGTCFEFALAIVEALQGKQTAEKVREPMLVKM